MKDPRNRTGRAARDHLVSLLGLGVPGPLNDLALDYVAEVVFGAPTDIRIRGAQADVRYQLCDEDGNPLPAGDQFAAQLSAGHGAEAAVLGSTLLTLGDLRDGDGLLRELNGAQAGVSGWLWQQLTPETQELVRSTDSNPEVRRAVLGVLLDEANVLVRQATLFDADRFRDVSLSPWTRNLIAQPNLNATEQTRLNRFLLEDAFPLLIWRTLAIPTPPIKEDVTFTILATRTGLEGALFLETYLAQSASLRAGITTSLKVQFPPDQGQATIVNHGDLLTVDVAATQEGVSYQLCLDQTNEVLLSDPVPGNRVIVSLTTRTPATEDFGIKVKAFRTSTPSVVKFLDTRLLVSVRPNPRVDFAAAPPIVAYAQGAAVALVGAQSTAGYQLFKRPIAPAEFVDAGTAGAITVPTTDGHSVAVLVPPVADAAAVPAGFELVRAFATKAGALQADTGPLPDDTVFAVRATKTANGQRLFLEKLVVVLARPNPAPKVSVDRSPLESGATGLIFVSGTQRGVRYQLRSAVDGSPVGLPGYHFEDRGVEAARLEVDWVVEGMGDERVLLPTGPLEQTTAFGVVAIKNITGLSAALDGSAQVEVTVPPGTRDMPPSFAEPARRSASRSLPGRSPAPAPRAVIRKQATATPPPPAPARVTAASVPPKPKRAAAARPASVQPAPAPATGRPGSSTRPPKPAHVPAGKKHGKPQAPTRPPVPPTKPSPARKSTPARRKPKPPARPAQPAKATKPAKLAKPATPSGPLPTKPRVARKAAPKRQPAATAPAPASKVAKPKPAPAPRPVARVETKHTPAKPRRRSR